MMEDLSRRNDMKLSTNLVVDSLQDVAAPSKKIEDLGFESLYISERKHEPFMQLAVAATATCWTKCSSTSASRKRAIRRAGGVYHRPIGERCAM